MEQRSNPSETMADCRARIRRACNDEPNRPAIQGTAHKLSLQHLASRGRDTDHCVARVNNARRPIRQFLIIDRGMVGGNQRDIVALNRPPVPVDRTGAGPMRVLSRRVSTTRSE